MSAKHTASSTNTARMMKIKFKSLSSGSCGNCYFLGIFSEDGRCDSSILIDAGVSPRSLKNELRKEGLSPDCIGGMLITHDHNDHIRSLGSYCKHLSYPVWSPSRMRRAIAGKYYTGEHYYDCARTLEDGWNEIIPGKIKARWFELPHDAAQTVGYAILLGQYKFVIMTDLGHITEQAAAFASQADTVVIESNYDLNMLKNGPYPRELKERIMNGSGHLSNIECASAIAAFDHEGLRNVFLCHLSEHNNTPELALEASRTAINPAARLCALPRTTASPLFEL